MHVFLFPIRSKGTCSASVKEPRRIALPQTKWLLPILVLAMFCRSVSAEENDMTPLTDRLMIRGGWAYVFGVHSAFSYSSPNTGVGTTIDFSKTLGGDTSTNAFRIDTLYRFNERHAMGFSYYRVGLSGQSQLNEQIQIEDKTINAGAFTNTSINLNFYRLIYNYSFYHTGKVELGVSPGLYMVNTRFSLAAQGTINNLPSASTSVNERLTVPLPSLGFLVNYKITPKLEWQNRFDLFYLAVGQYRGSMLEFYSGLEYRFFEHVAVGAAYDRLSIGLENTSKNGYTIDVNYNLTYLYATLYFF